MFPKTGKDFPRKDTSHLSNLDYSRAIAEALKRELGGSHHAAKTLMKWTGANERTVRNWLSGDRGPSGAHLISLVRESAEVLEILLLMSERQSCLLAVKLVEVRHRLAKELQAIQVMLDELSPDVQE